MMKKPEPNRSIDTRTAVRLLGCKSMSTVRNRAKAARVGKMIGHSLVFSAEEVEIMRALGPVTPGRRWPPKEER